MDKIPTGWLEMLELFTAYAGDNISGTRNALPTDRRIQTVGLLTYLLR